MLSPDHFCNAEPYTVVTISSVISCVVVVVEFIDPCVNWGVTSSAFTAVGDRSSSAKSHFLILLFSLP